MADDQAGQRAETWQWWPFTRVFSAFRVALDPKKLLLAAAGILIMALGWFVLSWFFYALSGGPPMWSEYDPGLEADKNLRVERWEDLKRARARWNLLHEMAGRPPASVNDIQPHHRDDAVDLARTLNEYEDIDSALKGRERFSQAAELHPEAGNTFMLAFADGKRVLVTAADPKEKKLAGLAKGKSLPVEVLTIEGFGDARNVRLDGIRVLLTEADLAVAQQYLSGFRLRDQLRRDALTETDPVKKETARKILRLLELENAPIKPVGTLRTLPWFEYRGPNPYLLVSGNIKTGAKDLPRERGIVSWFFTEQVPVLLEPLIKLLRPVLYFFDARGGFWNRVYLFFVLVWTLAVWGLFGGAITRMAAVQVARPGERVGLSESVRFAWSRYQSYFSAPLFPLLFVAFLTVFLILFGLVEGFTWFFGDIFIAGLLWPIVLILGLIMAVVLVGLVGWPLMYATISSEGSDSFDALSRSYSYVYQAPWHYVWYSLVALVYGAVLVFFIGFMGSLLVFLGKWGVSQAPLPQSREPTYLFMYSPTSFGWRSLLVQGPNAEVKSVILPNGTIAQDYDLRPKYLEAVSWNNRVGAVLVGAWLYLVFLLVVGFGYSYFWTASTIIYLLMRLRVDDTEMDEIHLDEEEIEEPFVPEPAKEAAKAEGVTMVESPSLRTAAPGGTAPPTAPPPSASPAERPAAPPTDYNPPPSPPGENPPPLGGV
jgi:hypothetical protein